MKKGFLLVTMILFILLFSISAFSDTDYLSLGTSTIGGTYYVLGAGWANIMNQNIPEIEISVEVGGGGPSNIQLIQQGDIELGMAPGWHAGEAFRGEGWAEGKVYDEIRATIPLYTSTLHIYTLAKNPIETIYDFEGKHISVGSAGTSSNMMGRALLEYLDIEPSRISSLPTNTAVNALKDGTVDAGFAVTGTPGPFMLDLETTHEVRHIGFEEEDLEKILKDYPYWAKGVLEKGAYKHLDEDIFVIQLWNFGIADKDLSEEIVYKLVSETFKQYDELQYVDPVTKTILPENILYSTIPLHKGALKYYQEEGLEIPEKLID